MKPKRYIRLAFPLASGIAALISAPTVHAADLYWNTNGTGGLLTAPIWASSSAGPFSTAWADGSDIFFTANSAITNFTNTPVGNLTITGGSTVTLTAAGTYSTGEVVRTFDIGTGSTLVWNGQDISTAAGTGFIKNGGGTWNLGAPSTSFSGGLTLNAGTIIAGGVNALGSGGALNINGGTIRSSSTAARDFTGKLTAITIGGDFALGDTTNNGLLTFNAATNLGAADRTITLHSAAVFNGIIGGDSGVGLKKAGGGTLTLSGTAVNTFDGGLDVNSGTLALNFANFASGWTDIVNSANALTFGGGLLTIAGENSANNTTQSFAGVTVNAGGGSLLVNPNGAGVSNGTTVTLGALTTTAAGSSLVLGKALSAGTGTVTLTTTIDKDATGIYGGRVVFADGTASTGYNWASTSTVSSPYTLDAYSGYNATLPTSGSLDSTNYGIAAGITLAASQSVNTLKITGSATALALDAFTMTLKSGGLLSTGTTAQTISGTAGATRLTAGSGAGGSEDLVIHQYIPATSPASGLIITAVIGDNTAGSGNVVNLVKAGLGSLQLSGANTYTGDTFINAGTLSIGNNGAGTLGAGNYSGDIVNNGTLRIASSDAQILSGDISGSGSLEKRTSGNLTLTGANTFTGKVSIGSLTNPGGAGALIVSSFNSVNGGTPLLTSSSLGAPTTVANGTIDLGTGNSSPNPTLRYVGTGETTDRVINLAFNGGANRTLEASNASGLLKFTSNFAGSGASTPSGSLILTGTGNGEIAGNIPEFYAGAKLAKQGGGTWTLSGTNGYTGATTVSAGTLLVNGSLAAASAVSVTAGTLGGTGTINGTVTIGNSAGTADSILAPGTSTSIGAIATGNLAFNSDGRYSCELNGTSATSDRANVTGTVSINTTASLAVSLTGSLAAGQKYFIVVNDDVGPLDLVTGTFSGLAQNAVVNNFGGTDLKISYTGNLATTAITGGNDIVLYTDGGGITFADWKTTNGAGLQTLADDHDGDGVDNGTEYFLFGSGNSTGFTALPGITNTLGTLSVTWTKGASYAGTYGTDFVVETSATLAAPWTTETSPGNISFPSANEVKYTFPGGPAYSGKNFARLRVTGP